jgi:hypothetical protein
MAYDGLLSSILSEYPRLKGLNWGVIDAPRRDGHPGPIEFFHPQEPSNARPGSPTVEIYDKNFWPNEKALQQGIFGDMLHYMPDADPEFARARESFMDSMTPDQLAVDKRAYERAKAEYGESRPFEDWFRVSRLDGYLRGYLAPDPRAATDPKYDWGDTYSTDQRSLLSAMDRGLRAPRGGLLFDTW